MTPQSDESGEPKVDGRTLRHQHRRPEIVDALTEYILENGIAELSVRQAAKAIGVTHVTLLRHFATKEDLVVEVVNKILRDLVARAEAEFAGQAAPTLEDFLWSQWSWLNQPRERRQFLLLYEIVARQGRSGGPADAEVARLVTDDLVAPYRAMLVRAFGLTAEDAATVAVLAIAQIRGLVLDLVVTGDRERADRAMREFGALLALRIASRSRAT